MALQERVIACGSKLTLFGLALRFVVSPATMAIGSIASGLHGNVLRIAMIQVIKVLGLSNLRGPKFCKILFIL